MGVAHAQLHRLGSPPADARPGKVPDNWPSRRHRTGGSATESAMRRRRP